MKAAEKQRFLNKASRLQHQQQNPRRLSVQQGFHCFSPLPHCPLFPLPCSPHHHGPPLEGPDWDPAIPGLFTELFWHELQEDEMPIKPPSIFATAKSTALGFTDIHSFEISSLQHLSRFKHALPGHEIVIGRATPLRPSSHLPAQAAYQQPCLCP